MNNRVIKFCVFLASVLLIASCNKGPGTPNTSTGNGNAAAPGGKAVKLAFVTNNASDYWTIARKGVEKADAELTDVTVEFKLPGEGTAAEQLRLEPRALLELLQAQAQVQREETEGAARRQGELAHHQRRQAGQVGALERSEEHTSELQSR